MYRVQYQIELTQIVNVVRVRPALSITRQKRMSKIISITKISIIRIVLVAVEKVSKN